MMAFFNKPLRHAEECFHGNCLYANPLLSQEDEKCGRSMASVPAEVTPDTEMHGKCYRCTRRCHTWNRDVLKVRQVGHPQGAPASETPEIQSRCTRRGATGRDIRDENVNENTV